MDFASDSELEGSLAQQLREQEAERDKQSESKPCATRHFLFFRQREVGQPHEEDVNTVTILSSALPSMRERALEPTDAQIIARMWWDPNMQESRRMASDQQQQQQLLQQRQQQKQLGRQNLQEVGTAHAGEVRWQPTLLTSEKGTSVVGDSGGARSGAFEEIAWRQPAFLSRQAPTHRGNGEQAGDIGPEESCQLQHDDGGPQSYDQRQQQRSHQQQRT